MIHLSRGEDGHLHLVLPVGLARRMETLPNRLLEVLARDATVDAAARRLFPSFSSDPAVEADLRAVAMEDLRRKKSEQVRAFAASLAGATPMLVRFRQLRLTREETESWIGFLNDMRLFLGIVLNIQANDAALDLSKHRPRPESDEWLYLFLSELQGALIAADEPQA